MKRKEIFIAIVAIAVAMALFMPGAVAFANFGTIGITPNSENTGDMENMVEISTNSDTSDNIETTASDAENLVIEHREKPFIDREELAIETDANIIVSVVPPTDKIIYVDDDNTEDTVTARTDTNAKFDDTGDPTLGFPPAGWTIDDLGAETGDSWKLKEFGHSGTCSAYVSYKNWDQDEWLITPEITLPSGSPSMEFYHYWEWSGYDSDNNYLKISTDSGSTWTTLDSWFDPGGDVWFYETYDLSTYAGMDVKLAWQYVSNYGENWYIDDIDIAGVIVEGFEPGPEKIVYVDDDADPDWYNETHVKTITEGITNASTGDTVYVFNGTYYEHVIVDKRLNLIGESRENVIVDGSGSGNVFYLTTPVNDVSIDTFTITNGSNGIFLHWYCSNNVIMNCDVYNNSEHGIFLSDSSYNNITDCNVYNNNEYGIYLHKSSECKLEGNAIYDNACNFAIGSWTFIPDISHYNHDISSSNTIDGKPIFYFVDQEDITLDETDNFGYLGLISCTNITAENSDVNGVLVIDTTDSTISNVSSHNSGTWGIYVYMSSDNNIINCSSYDNKPGEIAAYGIYLEGSSNNNITNCSAYNNTRGIYLSGSSGNNIINCNAYNNTEYSNYMKHGIFLGGSSNNNIINCSAYNNGNGIYLDGSSYNNITDCDVYNNFGEYEDMFGGKHYGYGIYIYKSSRNSITNCNIYDNGEGFSIYFSSNSELIDNTIYDNLYNFDVSGYGESDFIHDIAPSNTIDGKPIFYFVDRENIILDETDNFGYIGLVSCTNITVKNSNVGGVLLADTTDSTISNVDSYNSGKGIYLDGSSYNNITDCNAYNNREDGIYLSDSSSDNNITNCDAYNNNYGIFIYESPSNNITNCDIYNNINGIYIGSSSNNKLIDNTIYDNVYNFGVGGTVIDHFEQYIEPSNTVNEKAIYYLVNQENITLDETNNIGYLALISCTNITAKNSDVCGIMVIDTIKSTISNVSSRDSIMGIYLIGSSDNNIINCDVYNNRWGIYPSSSSNNNNIINCNAYNNSYYGIMIYKSSDHNIINCNAYNNAHHGFVIIDSSDNNIIINCSAYNNSGDGIYHSSSLDNNFKNCNIYNNRWGIYIHYSSKNSIINCNIYNNEEGIYFTGSSTTNLIHHNNFVNNVQNAHDEGSNMWDDGSEGNYWSDYTGVDGDGDGIGDTPYYIFGGNKDRYPLMMIIDDTPPMITDVQATPKAQTKTEPVNITCTVTDNWGLVDTVKVNITGPEGFTLEATMNIGSYWYENTYATMGVYYYYIIANDTSGNIATSDTYSFIIKEFGPPISTVDPLPAWETIVPFTVTATAYDDTGIANVTLWSRYSSDKTDWTDWTSYGTDEEEPWSWSFTGVDGYYEFYSIAVDDCANIEDPPDDADASTGIDTVPPITTIILNGTIGDNGWYVSDVTVTLSATDELSGVDSTWYSLDSGYWNLYTGSPFTVSSEGQHTVEYYSFDKAENREDTKSADFKIDKTPPVTEHEFDGVIGDNGWYTSCVTITLSATDDGYGVAYIMYKLGEGEWMEYTEPFEVCEDGMHILWYYSVDSAGNEEDEKGPFDFNIDQTPPTIDLTWDDDDSKLVADVADETSGVAKVEFYVNGDYVGEDTTSPYEWEVTKPRRGDKGQATVYDNAGNDAISEEIDAVSQSQSQSSSSYPVPLWPSQLNYVGITPHISIFLKEVKKHE